MQQLLDNPTTSTLCMQSQSRYIYMLFQGVNVNLIAALLACMLSVQVMLSLVSEHSLVP